MIDFFYKSSCTEVFKMRINSIQIALFYDALPLRADRFAALLSDAYETRFDKMPITLPDASINAPGMPLVIQQSSHCKDQITIAIDRADLYCNSMSGFSSTSECLASRREDAKLFCKQAISAESTITRIGIILSAYDTTATPVDSIAKVLGGNYSDAYELSFRTNYRETRNGISFNKISELTSGMVSEEGGEQQPAIILLCDINSVREGNYIFTQEQLFDAIDFAFDRFAERDGNLFA